MPVPAPLLIAGATGYGAWPANSLEGARACLAAPVDGIEIDVQLTADGQVVAHHDYRLSPQEARLDGAWIETPSAPLKTLTLEALRRYDLGRLRPGSDEARRHPAKQDMDGVRIPTLGELLGLLKTAGGPRRLIYVEIKTDPQNPDHAPAPESITTAVMDELGAADYLDHAKIIAFDWQVLRLVKARRPQMMTAHLTVPAMLKSSVKRGADGRSPWTDGCDPLDHGDSDMRAIKAHGGMEWSPYYTDVTPQCVQEAAELGLKVGPWGLNAAQDIARMQALHVWSATVSGPAWGRD